MNILLVEDSVEVSCITIEYLQELQHEVHAVPDAEQAVRLLETTPFDAVMTDISLPGISGIELARIILKKYPRLPVVIASGYGSLDVELAMGGAAANVFMLPKPYDLAALESTLGAAATVGGAS